MDIFFRKGELRSIETEKFENNEKLELKEKGLNKREILDENNAGNLNIPGTLEKTPIKVRFDEGGNFLKIPNSFPKFETE